MYKSLAGAIGIPSVHWFGTECDYNVLVLEYLGPSLEDLFNCHNRKFSLPTVLLLADQLVCEESYLLRSTVLIATTQISRIEYVHTHHLVHGDIKPANLLMGVGDYDNQVYMIDFGLARRYRDPRTRLHISCKAKCDLTGNTPYASINNHLGVEQSRRDDLESIAYLLIYFLHGSLPWHDAVPTTNEQQRATTLQTKMNTQPDILCSACPIEFNMFLSYVRALHFEDKPDYGFIRRLFRELFVREGYHHDHPFAVCTESNNTDDTKDVIGTGTSSGQRAERENGPQYTGGRMYVLRSFRQSLLNATCLLACALIFIAVIYISSWYL